MPLKISSASLASRIHQTVNFFKSRPAQSLNDASQPKVAIIDTYRTRLSLRYRKPTHGEVVEAVLLANLPRATVERVSKGNNMCDLINAFQNVAGRIKEGEHIDAVNLSSSHETTIAKIKLYSDLSELTPENFFDYREEILEWLKSEHEEFLNHLRTFSSAQWISLKELPDSAESIDFKSRLEFAEVYLCIKAIEEVTKQGVPVYVSGGNDKTIANLFALAEGTICVGALDSKGDIAKYSSRAVSCFALGTYTIKPIIGNRNLFSRFQAVPTLSYSVEGNGTSSMVDMSSKGKLFVDQSLTSNWHPVRHGTSFASPTQLAYDLKKKYKIR